MTLFESSDAVISPCGLYRYRLGRQWDREVRPALFVMLNPSTADATQDDATIRKCIAFARRWGCGGISVVNLFAFRATDPKALATAADPVGPDNDMYLLYEAGACHPVVAAWGTSIPKKHRGRVEAVKAILRSVGVAVRCLKLTKDGSPWHPLFVAGATELVPLTL